MSAAQHRIRHFVYLDPGDRSSLVPRESGMRGAWPCEAKCSCGWETRTGGAVRSYINSAVDDHKLDVELGIWKPVQHPFRVSLHESPGDKFILHFDCMAEDADHAAEQAENAYPGCEVIHEMEEASCPATTTSKS